MTLATASTRRILRLCTLFLFVVSVPSQRVLAQTVTNNADSGAGSLRQAIADASPGAGPRRRLAPPGLEKGLLALDVEVDGSLRDPQGLGHVGDLGAPVALVDEDPRRAVEQILQAAFGDDSRRHDWIITD